MDTLDTVAANSAQAVDEASTYGQDLITDAGREATKLADAAEDKVEDTVEEAKEAVRKVNWWRIAGFTAGGVAIACAYAYWRNQQEERLTRLERLRAQLGLADVDFRHLRSTASNFDFDRLNESRRKFGTYAKKLTHKGAKKVVELTR